MKPTKRSEDCAIGCFLSEITLWKGMGGVFDLNGEAKTIVNFPYKLVVHEADFYFQSLDEAITFRQGYENGMRAERNLKNLPKRMD